MKKELGLHSIVFGIAQSSSGKGRPLLAQLGLRLEEMAYEEEPGLHIRIHDMMGRWMPDVSLGVDHFFGYVRFTVTRLDEFEFVEESHMSSELYVWWTQPTPPYYRHRGGYSSFDGSDGSDDGDSEDSERTLTAPIYPIPLEENLESSIEDLHLWEEEESEEHKDEENDLPEISSQVSCC
ncbi:hypothetical protein V8G54_010871 [Vigna mungo]|uniref:Uncharacterized protein n=1 Tax=Vigna mungo TaxID=3915 RepID=A0AAQ3S3J1_VIGMU